MPDPTIHSVATTGIAGVDHKGPARTAAQPQSVDGKDFKSYLLDSLDKVNSLQNEAALGMERLLTGQTDNTAEVLSAIRKADVAFSLLTEIRNKLMDVYSELKQMRV